MPTSRCLHACVLAMFAALVAAPVLAQSPGAAKTPLGPNVDYMIEVDRTIGLLAGFDLRPESAAGKGSLLPEGFVMHVGASAPPALYQWIGASLGNAAMPLECVVFGTVASKGTLEEVGFSGGRLAGVGFPALDVASREPMQLAVHVEARTKRRIFGDQTKLPPAPGAAPWMASAFRVTMGNIDPKGIVRVNAFTLQPNRPAKLVLFAQGAAAAELEKALGVAASSPTKLQTGKGPLLQQVRLDFLSTNGRAVLATLDLQEVRMSLAPGSRPLATTLGKGMAQSAVEISAAKATLRFSPALGQGAAATTSAW